METGTPRHRAAVLAFACGLLLAGCTDPAPLVIGRPGLNPGELDRPRGVAAADGRVAVVDLSGRLQVFTAAGELVAGFPVMPEGARRGFPLGVLFAPAAADGLRDLLVVHTHEAAIVRYGPDGGERSRFGNHGIAPGDFGMPQRAVIHDGALVISDFGYPENKRVHRFALDGTWRGDLPQPPGEPYGRPMGVTVTPGTGGAPPITWVCDTAHRIVRFRGDDFLDVVGRPGEAAGELRFPTGIVPHPDGGVVVCEAGNHRLQWFDAAGRSRGTWGRRGPGPNRFDGPYDLAWDAPWLYVADTDNHRVLRLRLDAIEWEPGETR